MRSNLEKVLKEVTRGLVYADSNTFIYPIIYDERSMRRSEHVRIEIRSKSGYRRLSVSRGSQARIKARALRRSI